MMNDGWIKLHRKIIENPVVWEDPEALKVWLFFLLEAASQERDVMFKGQRTTLQPGQFLSSVRVIAQKTGISKSKIHRIINRLKSETQLGTQESNKNTLFTIKNWLAYQKRGTQSGTQVGHKWDTEQEGEELKNNIYIDSDESISPSHEDEQAAVKAWNEMAKLTGLPVVTKLASRTKREKMLRARIKEYGLDDVIKAIDRVKQSKFLQGKKTDFCISFEWMVKPNNFSKVLEGNYDDSRRSAEASSTERHSAKGWAERRHNDC